MAVEIKLDKLELNPAQKHAQNNALERKMKKAMEAHGTNLLMHEMIEPERKAMKKPQKAAAPEIGAAVIKPEQMSEFAKLSYTSDITVISSNANVPIKNIKHNVVEKKNEPKREEETPLVGYHAKREKDQSGRYKEQQKEESKYKKVA